MAQRGDTMPRGDEEFLTWLKNLIAYCRVKMSGTAPEWTTIPEESMKKLEKGYEDYYNAFVMTRNPHGKPETTAKNVAKKAAEAVARPFVQQFMMFDPVTDVDRDNVKIRNRDRTISSVGRPAKAPVLQARPIGERLIAVEFWEEGSASKARPYGYSGAVLFHAVLDRPPESQDELIKSDLATKTPFILEFKETDRGKKVYIAAAWQNKKGQLGPVSGIIMAVVP